MKFIKKFWQYQKLLLSSIQLGNIDPSASPQNNAGCLSLLFMILIYGFLMYIFNGMNIMLLVIVAVAYSYGIATSRRKLYALVPVSKKYSLFNLYLLPLVISVIAAIVLWIFTILAVLVLWLFVFLAKAPQDNASSPTDMLASSAGIETILFCVMLVLIVIFVMTAISVIRRRKIRLIYLWSFFVISSGLMIWLKTALPVSSESTTVISFDFNNILPGFEKMPSACIILTCMAVVLIVIAPISILFAYKEYMSDVLKHD